jgi:hypothetical protein
MKDMDTLTTRDFLERMMVTEEFKKFPYLIELEDSASHIWTLS